MGKNKVCRDKLSQYKIGGPSKPYIDENLQFQLPGHEGSGQHSHPSSTPIYSHYVGSSPSLLSLQVNEKELFRAMKEAEQSYEAWKNMQKKIEDAAKKLKNS